MSPTQKLSPFEAMLCSDQLKNKMMKVAMSMTQKNKAASLDLMQNTYVKALQNQDKFLGSEIDPWVITILKNLQKDEWKRKKEIHMGVNSDLPDMPGQDESETTLLERDKDYCMDTLTPEEQTIISLNQVSTYAEISKDLEVEQGTLRQRLRRAREKFMECMGFDNE